MKTCPFCAEKIQAAAVVCKHCGRELTRRAPPRKKRTSLGAVLGLVLLLFFWLFAAVALRWTAVLIGLAALALAVGLLVSPSRRRRAWRMAVVSGLMGVIGLGSGAVGVQGSKIARKEKTADLASLPHRLEAIRADIRAGQWRRAQAHYAAAVAINANYPGLHEAGRNIGPQIGRLDAKQAEETRQQRLAAGLEAAKAIVHDHDRCDTPKQIADAWKNLKLARPADKGWAEARRLTAGLERCRRKSEWSFSRGIHQLMVSQRQQAAKAMENRLLGQGMDARVTVHGRGADRIRISYALMGRAMVYQVTNGGSSGDGTLLGNLEKVGFRKVTFSDGFQFGETYTLSPPDERHRGRQVMAGLGLDKPLALRP